MAAAKIDFRCHIGTEEFQCFLTPPPLCSPSKRTLSFSEPAAPGVVCFLLFFQLESIDLTEWRAISDISPSLQACGVICWRFSAMLYVHIRPAQQKKPFFRCIMAYDFFFFFQNISPLTLFFLPEKYNYRLLKGVIF